MALAGLTASIVRSVLGADNLPLSRIVRLGLNQNPYGSKRLGAELGWEPEHHALEALERTGRWVAARV